MKSKMNIYLILVKSKNINKRKDTKSFDAA